jgi:hypothetical protein
MTGHSVAICAVLYWLRIFAIGAGYHRYFSHGYHHRSTGLPSAATIASARLARPSCTLAAMEKAAPVLASGQSQFEKARHLANQ